MQRSREMGGFLHYFSSSSTESGSWKSVPESLEQSLRAKSGVGGTAAKISPELQDLARKGALVKVKNLGIYREPMPPFHVAHDALVIQVASFVHKDKITQSGCFIKAEKGMIHTEKDNRDAEKENRDTQKVFKGRIEVQKLDTFSLEVGVKRAYKELKGCGKILMKDLIDLLEKTDTNAYSLFTDNCWKYADRTFRKLIMDLSELLDTTKKAKERLQRYLKELPRHRLPGNAFNPSRKIIGVCLTCSTLVGVFTVVGTAICAFKSPVLGLGAAKPLFAGLSTKIGVLLGKFGLPGIGAFVAKEGLIFPKVWAAFSWAVGLRNLATVIAGVVGVCLTLFLGWALHKFLYGWYKNSFNGFAEFVAWVATGGIENEKQPKQIEDTFDVYMILFSSSSTHFA